jgi:glutathione S-transferase
MKLLLSPGACSMSCHIAFEEAGLKFEPVIGDWAQIQKHNPMGAVPVLVMDDGRAITQNIAILTYAANLAPRLLPKPGTFEHVEAYQWLAWTSSDLHPTFGPLFDDSLPEAERKQTEAEVHKLLAIADSHLAKREFLAAGQFTIADALFFTIYGWTRALEIPNEQYRNLNAYASRIAERPAVQRVMKREGLS